KVDELLIYDDYVDDANSCRADSESRAVQKSYIKFRYDKDKHSVRWVNVDQEMFQSILEHNLISFHFRSDPKDKEYDNSFHIESFSRYIKEEHIYCESEIDICVYILSVTDLDRYPGILHK